MTWLYPLKRRSFNRRWLVPLGLALLAFQALVQAQTIASRESRIKAVLIVKLIKFVDWPTEVLPAGAALQLCTLGESAMTAALANVDGQAVQERILKVRKIASLGGRDLAGCHVLVVSDTFSIHGGLALRDPSLRHVLTVGDGSDFRRLGGIVTLVNQDNRVAFQINLTLAKDLGLRIGAPLLRLAVDVD